MECCSTATNSEISPPTKNPPAKLAGFAFAGAYLATTRKSLNVLGLSRTSIDALT
jgi:hypothetical protein